MVMSPFPLYIFINTYTYGNIYIKYVNKDSKGQRLLKIRRKLIHFAYIDKILVLHTQKQQEVE